MNELNTIRKEDNLTNLTNGVQYSDTQLLEALRDVEDLMDQLLTPYFLLGKTAECVKNNRLLEGTGIDIGIRDKHVTQYFCDIIADRLKLTKDQIKDGFEYKAVNGVPVRIKVYTRNYSFFKYPDHVVYQYGTYQLANPFNSYWKAQYIIK